MGIRARGFVEFYLWKGAEYDFCRLWAPVSVRRKALLVLMGGEVDQRINYRQKYTSMMTHGSEEERDRGAVLSLAMEAVSVEEQDRAIDYASLKFDRKELRNVNKFY